MTNILEKSLLIGFGLFILIIFLSFSAPFINAIITFNTREKSDLNSYLSFIDDIDKGINHVIEYQDRQFIQTIEYPQGLNITFIEKMAKFNFFLANQYCQKIIEYNEYFIAKQFYNIPPQYYVLNITMELSKILITLM